MQGIGRLLLESVYKIADNEALQDIIVSASLQVPNSTCCSEQLRKFLIEHSQCCALR